MSESYFMGLDGFVWFTGVVENRQDPAKLGRVQVRCLGFHSEKLTDIPTEDLPWAHVMHPVTDPAMQGLGNTPSFLVEGTWVIGFFRDAVEKQQPIIMGTLPGYPSATPDTTKGFNDPTGKYPTDSVEHSFHSLDESDVSKLARGVDAEGHRALIERRGNRSETPTIQTAIKPDLKVVNDKSKTETASSFSEPHPRGVETTDETNTGVYPFNHVHESESGHILEIDDTPNGERLLRQHKNGTYEEITNTTRTVRVGGDIEDQRADDYLIVTGDSNVYIMGNANVVTDGTLRHRVKGDYVLEVGGDFTRKIDGNEKVKIGAKQVDDGETKKGGGNLEEVIRGNHTFSIEGGISGAIGTREDSPNKDSIVTVAGNDVRQVGASFTLSVTGQSLIKSVEESSLVSDKRLTAFSAANIDLISGTVTNLKAGTNMNIKSEAVGTLLFSGNSSTVTAKNGGGTAIELTGHVHGQPDTGVDATVQGKTLAPVA